MSTVVQGGAEANAVQMQQPPAQVQMPPQQGIWHPPNMNVGQGGVNVYGRKPSSDRHSPRTLNKEFNRNNNDTFIPLAAATIAVETVAGDAVTRACPINKEPTWQHQTSKAASKQAGSGTNSSSNSMEIHNSHPQWRMAIKCTFQQTLPTVGPTDMRWARSTQA